MRPGPILLLLGLAWTAVLATLFALAGKGGAIVVRVSRWLDIEPATTQWLADGLDSAGPAARWLFAIVWAAGVAALAAISHSLSRSDGPGAS